MPGLSFYCLLIMQDNSMHASTELKCEKLFCGQMFEKPTESKIIWKYYIRNLGYHDKIAGELLLTSIQVKKSWLQTYANLACLL